MQTILLTFLVILLSLNYLSAKENDTFNDIKKLKNNIDFKIKKFDEDYETVKMILNNDYEDYIKYLVIQRFFRKHSQDIGLTNHDNKIKLNLKVLLNEVNHLIDIKEINNIKKYLSDEYYFNEISSLSNNSNDYDKYDILYNAGKKIKDNKFFEEAYKIKNEQSHSSETEKIKSFLEVCEKQIRYLGLKFCDDSLKKYSNFDFSSNFKKYVNYISNNPNKEVRLGSGVFLEYVNIRVKSYIRNDNYDIPLIVARSRSNKKTSFSKLYKDIAWQMFKSNKHDLLEILIDDLKLSSSQSKKI